MIPLRYVPRCGMGKRRGWGGNGEVRVSCTGMGRSGRDRDGRRVEE